MCSRVCIRLGLDAVCADTVWVYRHRVHLYGCGIFIYGMSFYILSGRKS